MAVTDIVGVPLVLEAADPILFPPLVYWIEHIGLIIALAKVPGLTIIVYEKRSAVEVSIA